VGGSPTLHPGANSRGNPWGGHSSLNVWTPNRFSFSASSGRRISVVQRICSDLWLARRDLGLFSNTLQLCCLCGRSIHHGGLLVYFINVLRQSGCDNCEGTQQHVCWYSTRGRSWVLGCTIRWGSRCDCDLPMVDSWVARASEGYCDASRGRANLNGCDSGTIESVLLEPSNTDQYFPELRREKPIKTLEIW